jgi:hypothetical protein
VKRTLAVALGAVVAVACSDSSAVDPTSPLTALRAPSQIATGDIIVTSSSDAGPGSFRQAILDANANPSIQSIAFHPSVNTIALASQVLYSGSQDLTIRGNHTTIDGASAGGTAFRVNTVGADLTLESLAFRNASGQGVHVEVLSAASGTVRLALTDVLVENNAGHGVLLNDQLDPSTEEGEQPEAGGSAASVVVVVVDSRFVGNGYSVSDRDGLRVNEGGAGDLTLSLTRVRSERNAADGVEIDERGDGSITVDVAGSSFTRNGVFDPQDLDDGFDIDEYDAGSIFATIVGTSANNNFEEGFDFNENNVGDLHVDMTGVEASGNVEEGIDLEEDDDFAGGGNLVTVMDDIRTFGNGDAADGALKIREKEAGNLTATLTNIASSHNIGSGLFVRESQGGNSVVHIAHVVSTANRAGAFDPFSLGHGVEILESGGGDLAATVTDVTVSANAGYGVFADASGSATASNVRGNGNSLGAVGGIITVVP